MRSLSLVAERLLYKEEVRGSIPRGSICPVSSAGRAPGCYPGGPRFDPSIGRSPWSHGEYEIMGRKVHQASANSERAYDQVCSSSGGGIPWITAPSILPCPRSSVWTERLASNDSRPQSSCFKSAVSTHHGLEKRQRATVRSNQTVGSSNLLVGVQCS